MLVLVAVPRPVAPPPPGTLIPVGTALGLVCVVSHAANAKTTTARIDTRNKFMPPNLHRQSTRMLALALFALFVAFRGKNLRKSA